MVNRVEGEDPPSNEESVRVEEAADMTEPFYINGVPFKIHGEHSALTCLSEVLDQPKTANRSVFVHNGQSFAEYVRMFGDETTRIWIDTRQQSIGAYIDQDDPEMGLQWQRHSVELKSIDTSEFTHFLNQCINKTYGPEELADVLNAWINVIETQGHKEVDTDSDDTEDGKSVTSSAITAGELVQMVQALRYDFRKSGEFDFELKGDQRRIMFDQESDIRGIRKGKAIPFPEFITMHVQVFESQDPYAVHLQLRTERDPVGGKPLFLLHHPDAPSIRRNAFIYGTMGEVASELQLNPILYGELSSVKF